MYDALFSTPEQPEEDAPSNDNPESSEIEADANPIKEATKKIEWTTDKLLYVAAAVLVVGFGVYFLVSYSQFSREASNGTNRDSGTA